MFFRFTEPLLTLPMRKRSSIARKMVIYFSLIVMVTVFMTCEFWVQFRVDDVTVRVLEKSSMSGKITAGAVTNASEVIRYWRNKVILLLAMLVVVTAMVFIMFVKNLIGPLNHMVKAAKKIASGDLRESIEIESNDELAEVGELINDLTANIQEIITNTLLYLEDIEENMYRCKKNLVEITKTDNRDRIADKVESGFEETRKSLNALKSLLNEFSLYEVTVKDKVK